MYISRNHGPAAWQAERQKRSAAKDVATGLTFVEVLAVVLDNEKTSDLYGSATVYDGLNPPVDVFRRGRSNAQPVRPGGCLELTGPSRAIRGSHEVVFDLYFMDADDKICKGQVVWNAYHKLPENVYNRAVVGDYGAVKVRYAVLTDAVVATVAVRLSDGGGDPDLYGSIMASTSAVHQHKMALFNTEFKDCMSLHAGDTIPLLRSVLVVPLGSYLYIDADLWDRDVLPDISPDDHITDDRAWFDPRLGGAQNKDIYGPHGHVTVYVTWSRT